MVPIVNKTRGPTRPLVTGSAGFQTKKKRKWVCIWGGGIIFRDNSLSAYFAAMHKNSHVSHVCHMDTFGVLLGSLAAESHGWY